MYIVAIAWIYVVLMMSITEESIIAGLMTFALYGILPLTIILYIMGSPQRKRQRHARELQARAEPVASNADDIGMPDVDPAQHHASADSTADMPGLQPLAIAQPGVDSRQSDRPEPGNDRQAR